MENRVRDSRQWRQKDWGLFVPLLILNVVSLWSTIRGTELALGHAGVAVMAGVSIQGILFILLSGMAASHVPFRKWIAILALGSISIYTSFFVYHNKFVTTDQMIGAQFRPAEMAHEQLVTTVVKPLQEDFDGLRARDLALEQAIDSEEGGEGITGLRGRGPEARKLIAERNELTPRLRELQLSVEKIQPLLVKAKALDSSASDAPDDLFSIDKAIWEAVPTDYREGVMQGPRREDYFDQASRFQLLTPLFNLLDGKSDPVSIASFTLASFIDGISIMLGTAIDRRARRAPFENVSDFLTQIIWGYKTASKSISYYLDRPGQRRVKVTDAESTMPKDVVHLVQLIINGPGSNFLMTLVDAIDSEKKEIDYASLEKSGDETYRRGYKLLLEAFRQPSLSWLDIKDDPSRWVFLDSICYASFFNWLNDEIIYQLQKEQEEGVAGIHTSPRVVPFRRPVAC